MSWSSKQVINQKDQITLRKDLEALCSKLLELDLKQWDGMMNTIYTDTILRSTLKSIHTSHTKD